MPRRTPIRIIVPKLHMSRHDQVQADSHSRTHTSSASFDQSSPNQHHRIPRTHRPFRPGRLHRHERPHSHPTDPIQGMPSPAHLTPDYPSPVASPPFRPSPSPSTEPVLLPGGGVQIPPGFRFSEADHGHYRPRSRDVEDGDPDHARGLGRMGFGMFKGLKKLPAAIVKAGRSYGPRSQENRPMSPVQETEHETEHETDQAREQEREQERERMSGEIPIQDDVETYVEPEESETPAREEQLLREYIHSKRMRRDRAYRQQRRLHDRDQRYVPSPQPVLLPGAHTPAMSAVGSQVNRSQTGRSDIPPAVLEAQLEAEQIRQEQEALARAQERERARHIYAAEAVKPPTSIDSSGQQYVPHESFTSHRRTASEPGLSNHVFSRWSAERDVTGRRRENRGDSDVSSTSPISAIVRLFHQIRDMPWVGDRVAADYVPGGVKPEPSTSHYYTSSPGSDSAFSSPYMTSGVTGMPLPATGANTPAIPRSKPGQSWYAPREDADLLVLPVGVAPPPGFIPFPYPVPPNAHTVVSADGAREGTASATSYAQGEQPQSRSHAPAGSSVTAPAYLSGEAYHYMPAEASRTGQPYIFVPTGDGRHQPLLVPEMGQRPAYVYSHPGPPNFVPATR